jgi:hypothetical protein
MEGRTVALTRHDQSNSNSDINGSMFSRLSNTPRRYVVAGLIAGGLLTGAVAANASTPTDASTPKGSAAGYTSDNGGSGLNLKLSTGNDRGTVLGASDAQKVRDAVYAKDQNMTIQQMTTDPGGGFQARGFSADGSHVTVQLTDRFIVLSERSSDVNRNGNGNNNSLFGNQNSTQDQRLLGGLL